MISIQKEDNIRKMVSVAMKNVKDGYIIGLGSGSTVAEFVRVLSSYVQRNNIEIRVIPSSLQIQIVAEESNLKVESSNLIPEINLTFDGADQVDSKFNLIKGGGGALFRERILMAAAQRTFILVDETKFAEKLDKPVPIEVSHFARSFVFNKLSLLNGKPQLRLNSKGYPNVTENTNIIFDTDFGVIHDPVKLESQIREIAGVIDAGIFVTNVDTIYKACKDGRVEELYIKH